MVEKDKKLITMHVALRRKEDIDWIPVQKKKKKKREQA